MPNVGVTLYEPGFASVEGDPVADSLIDDVPGSINPDLNLHFQSDNEAPTQIEVAVPADPLSLVDTSNVSPCALYADLRTVQAPSDDEYPNDSNPSDSGSSGGGYGGTTGEPDGTPTTDEPAAADDSRKRLESALRWAPIVGGAVFALVAS